MHSISCPHCSHTIKLETVKPGKFTPTCPSCKTKFGLIVAQAKDGSYRFKSGPLNKKSSRSAEGKKNQTSGGSPSKKSSNRTRVESKTKGMQDQTAAELTSTRASDSESFVVDLPSPLAETGQAEQTDTHAPMANDTFAGGATRPDLAVPTPAPKPSAAPSLRRLGSYKILKLLGQGGMGSVYLANQATLDRHVALKVVRDKVSNHPTMLARFTREAYAAAQLVHPNVVQIYDMGDERGTCFFSMELVDGCSLMDLVEKQKKLDPEQAASYILHAARGLQCAHNAGMVHRDIKPSNLLVNRDGMVKVADLGLVKVPDKEDIVDGHDEATALSASQELTQVGSALGTPYYMAPEQAKSSTEVDHRADIYSLGCTFYVLLTGRRPFEGSSAEEVVSKHSTAPLVLPGEVVQRVPGELNSIVAKMMAKAPADRYQVIGELIGELEQFLGLSSVAAFTPDEQDAELLEVVGNQFNESTLLKIRGILPLASLAGWGLLTLLVLLISPIWSVGFLMAPLFAVIAHFLITGLQTDSPVFYRVRRFVSKLSWLSLVKWPFTALLLVVASWMTGTFFPILITGFLGVAAGLSYYFLIDAPIQRSRSEALASAERLVRKMRLKGMNEDAIQLFIAKYGGKHWEELFEELFGYEAKRIVRDEIAKSGSGKRKPKFRAWRDRLCDNLDSKLEQIENQKDQEFLQKIEQAGLMAQGVSQPDAKAQAEQMAAALVDHGDSIRVAALTKQLNELDPQRKRLEQRLKVKSLLADAKSGRYKKQAGRLHRIGPVLDAWLGSYFRFLMGCCLMIGCMMWANQNQLFDVQQIQEAVINTASAIQEDGTDAAQDLLTKQAATQQQRLNVETKPLQLPLLGSFFYNFNSALAGLILVASTVVFGWRMSLFAVPAALVTMLGETFGIPGLLEVRHLHVLTAVIGIGIFVLGIVFGRKEA